MITEELHCIPISLVLRGAGYVPGADGAIAVPRRADTRRAIISSLRDLTGGWDMQLARSGKSRIEVLFTDDCEPWVLAVCVTALPGTVSRISHQGPGDKDAVVVWEV